MHNYHAYVEGYVLRIIQVTPLCWNQTNTSVTVSPREKPSKLRRRKNINWEEDSDLWRRASIIHGYEWAKSDLVKESSNHVERGGHFRAI
jgi:hypothetical protein